MLLSDVDNVKAVAQFVFGGTIADQSAIALPRHESGKVKPRRTPANHQYINVPFHEKPPQSILNINEQTTK
jgi:hypothetical protein